MVVTNKISGEVQFFFLPSICKLLRYANCSGTSRSYFSKLRGTLAIRYQVATIVRLSTQSFTLLSWMIWSFLAIKSGFLTLS